MYDTNFPPNIPPSDQDPHMYVINNKFEQPKKPEFLTKWPKLTHQCWLVTQVANWQWKRYYNLRKLNCFRGFFSFAIQNYYFGQIQIVKTLTFIIANKLCKCCSKFINQFTWTLKYIYGICEFYGFWILQIVNFIDFPFRL